MESATLEETLLKKGFFQAIFRKLLKVLESRKSFRKGVLRGKPFFKRGFPLIAQKKIAAACIRGVAASRRPESSRQSCVAGSQPIAV